MNPKKTEEVNIMKNYKIAVEGKWIEIWLCKITTVKK